MADKHPYMSGSGGIVQTITHLRRSFPAQVTAETLKKLGIASNNETYVLNILRFVAVLDQDGKKNAEAATVFNKHDDKEFQAGFAELVQTAYSDLFGLHGESAWVLPTDKLISYFRNTDHTSAVVGQRQASTFQALAGIAGKTQDVPRVVVPKAKSADKVSAKPAKRSARRSIAEGSSASPTRAQTEARSGLLPAERPAAGTQLTPGMALTVRVEINLPAGGDQGTYDRIFKSIRENLLNGNVA